MDKIKWGVLGTAGIAKICTIPGIKQGEHCELYAIAGRDINKARAFKEEFGFEKAYGSYEELLADADVQAVYIPLPNDIHIKWVLAAVKAGKHVLCEKPMALTACEAREMFAAAKENGVILMEAFAYLHSPYVASLKNDIERGIIGDLRFIETAFYTQGYEENFRLHKELGGGMVYDLGCYCTTMLLTLTEDEPEMVKAVAEFTDEGVDYNTATIVKFKKGVRASFNVGMCLGKESQARFDRLFIQGTKGSIRSDVEYNQQGEISYEITTPEGTITRKLTVPHNYTLEAENLSLSILGKATPKVTPEFSVKNAEFIDKVLEEIGW